MGKIEDLDRARRARAKAEAKNGSSVNKPQNPGLNPPALSDMQETGASRDIVRSARRDVRTSIWAAGSAATTGLPGLPLTP